MSIFPKSDSDKGKPSQSLIRLLVIDSCITSRDGLVKWIESTQDIVIIHCVDSAAQLYSLTFPLEVDIAILDVDLPDRGCLEVCKWLLRKQPGLIVLMISYWDWDVCLSAPHAVGASGLLLRRDPPDHILKMIRQAAKGEFYTKEQAERFKNWDATIGAQIRKLGPREWQVLWLLVAGLSNREIADQLSISENTIEKHISSILQKFNQTKRAMLVALILNNHLDLLNWWD